ncbi:MAG: hypothetical protein NT091_04635 [Candidatus Falkowbacteria bacterium]|nr:hypothetical protein [Candidatus Falkowbacteria bacterium]
MYIIPIIILLICLAIIGRIIFKRSGELSNLSVDTIASVREAQFKEEIISKRLKRNALDWLIKTKKITTPIFIKLVELVKRLHHRIKERKAKSDFAIARDEVVSEDQISLLFNEADVLFKKGDFNESEKRLINIIEVDHKNIEAFTALSQIYFEKKNYEEAKETLKHVIKLGGENDEIYFDIAWIAKTMGDNESWLENINKAITINGNNPRYLDSLLEVAILLKDRALALHTYQKLKKVDPSNGKLDQLHKQVKEL